MIETKKHSNVCFLMSARKLFFLSWLLSFYFRRNVCNSSYYNWHKLFHSLKFAHRNHLSTPPSKRTSKLSLKVLFFKASPQSDGHICAGPLMEQIPLNKPLSTLLQSFINGSIHFSYTRWLVSPSQLTILPKIYLAIASNVFGKFT